MNHRVCDVIRWLSAALLLLAAATWPASAAPAQNQAVPGAAKLSEAQLDQLVAPIALYPDPLLGQVLMASTYPLEVVEAARWSHTHPGVSGKALEDAMQNQPWDPSVKGLTAVPQTLQLMSDKLEWTQQLGDAFLAQQQDVLDALQRLRARAEAAGNLKTTARQKVTKSPPPPGVSPPPGLEQVITIEPTSDTYYVPIYDPTATYGTWLWPDYVPFYWYPPGWVAGNVVSFAMGSAVGAAIWGNIDWWRRDVTVNVDRFNRFNRTQIASNVWTHDPGHRGNVPYPSAAVAQRFHQAERNVARQNLQRGAGQSLAKRGGAKSGSKGRTAAQARAQKTGGTARSATAGRSRAHAAREGTRARKPDRSGRRARAKDPPAFNRSGAARAQHIEPTGGGPHVGRGGGFRGGGPRRR